MSLKSYEEDYSDEQLDFEEKQEQDIQEFVELFKKYVYPKQNETKKDNLFETMEKLWKAK